MTSLQDDALSPHQHRSTSRSQRANFGFSGTARVMLCHEFVIKHRGPATSAEANCAIPKPHSPATVSENYGSTAMTPRTVEVDVGKIEIETIGREIVLATPVSFDDVGMTVGQARLLAAALFAAASEAEGR